jgi:TonB family protein
MAENKSITFNNKYKEEFLKRLDEKPTARLNIVYQAVIVSLIAHAFMLFITQMLTQDHSMAEQQTYLPLEMDMIEPEMIQQLPEQQAQMQNRSGELRNVTANNNSQRTNDVVNYRGMTQQQINDQVYNDLKAMEAEEFAKLQNGKPDYTVKPSGSGTAQQQKQPDKNDWYNKQSQTKSYSGNVTASYDMSGRDANYNPVPTYRCKTQGTVVISVTINQLGEVTDAKINEAQSSLNECLRTESATYARKWKFNYKDGADKKQSGTISFTFSAQ